jgi:hypothetical protein
MQFGAKVFIIGVGRNEQLVWISLIASHTYNIQAFI